MSSKAQAGMTLIELILAIVIIGVGLGGVLMAFRTVVAGSADPLVQKQMLAIAEEMMEEISLQPFAAIPPASSNATPCTARSAFNDIMDYNNYHSDGGLCDMDGAPLTALSAYDVRVNITSAELGGIAAGSAVRLTVTVKHRGTDGLVLTGWRTNYAGGLSD